MNGKKGGKQGPDLITTLCPSTFYLTFVIELVGIDVFHDCNEGSIDLGAPVQGLKLQYQLVPGFNFDIDVVIWPHVAKVWCGPHSGWVRTWHFLQRRWLSFSIRHALAVRVKEYITHIVTVTPSFGLGNISSIAKNDKVNEVFLPKLSFSQRRQFAPVQECTEADESPTQFVSDLIWSCVFHHIPRTYADGPFDTPEPVLDKRHQDAVIQYVEETILNHKRSEQSIENLKLIKSEVKSKDLKEKKKAPEVAKYGISLTGDEIICGTGRITPFRTVGTAPSDAGEIIILIGSANLPASDDQPVVFINVGKLTDVPISEFMKYKISQLYTKWSIDEEEHISEPQLIASKDIDFNDHHAVPLPFNNAATIVSSFLGRPYQIELRGIRQPPSKVGKPIFFGYAKGDRDFATAMAPKTQVNEETDVLIAVTKIDLRHLTKCVNAFVRGEYPLYPPQKSVHQIEREPICSNDINGIRLPLLPVTVVPAGVILEAQMTLDVSVGLIGCKPQSTSDSFSRLYVLVSNSTAVMTILRHITEINELVAATGSKDSLLTGFALDTGDTVMLYVEGPKDGKILLVWEATEDFYPDMKPVFSTSSKYDKRLYSEMLTAAMPFNIMKMYVPLALLLACPPIYTRPALPLPTRIAVLKIGRLVGSKLLSAPSSDEMPTMAELKSFRLELCVAPSPPPVMLPGVEALPVKLAPPIDVTTRATSQSAQRVIWENPIKIKD